MKAKTPNMISVCMAVYNGEKFIGEQLATILPQLSDEDEVIISDNGSTDRTRECVERFADKRIKVISFTRVKSVVFNFENALRHASGSYIFLADCDDLWKPDKVCVMKSLLSTYDLVLCDLEVIDEAGNLLWESFYKVFRSGGGLMRNLVRNTFIGCAMAFRRSILEIALPFPEKIPMHDMWIGNLASLFGTTYFCPEKLMQYRRHPGNDSPTTGGSPNSLLQKLELRRKLVSALVKRSIEVKFLR